MTQSDRFSALEIELALGADRGADKLAPHARGGLETAARHLLKPGGCVAIFTGFYIAHAQPPAAETDGPLAAVTIAEALIRTGRDALLVTDTPCAPVLSALVEEAGLSRTRLLIADSCTNLEKTLKAKSVDTVLAIERPGQAQDGHCHYMRGQIVAPPPYPFDGLFASNTDLMRLAVGDGGNEIGMGCLPKDIIARYVKNGAAIASTTRADALVITGVSHWIAYGLAAAAEILTPDYAEIWRHLINDDRELARLETSLRAGAVDGLLGRAAPSIDGLDLATHLAKRDMLRAIASGKHGP